MPWGPFEAVQTEAPQTWGALEKEERTLWQEWESFSKVRLGVQQ